MIAFAPTLLLAAAAYSNLTWRSIGPAVAGGRVAGVAGTPQNDQLYYLGTAGGGVWKSDNGGATWTPVFDKQSVSAIGAVAIDPTNERVVWAGSGEANPRNNVSYGDGLYKTTDGAKTWTRVGLQGVWSISRIAVDPKNSQHVVVGAFGDPYKDSPNRGVYVTFDGGRSWNKTLYVSAASGASDIAMDPQNPSVVYAGMWHFRRVPWTFTSGGPDDGFYKSTDGGKTWRRLTGNGLPGGYTGRIGLAIAPSRPNRVFALIEAKGGILWRSDDAGSHWTLVSSDTLVDQRPFYFTHIAVDPHDAGHVYAVSEMLAESKDGGHKFTRDRQGRARRLSCHLDRPDQSEAHYRRRRRRLRADQRSEESGRSRATSPSDRSTTSGSPTRTRIKRARHFKTTADSAAPKTRSTAKAFWIGIGPTWSAATACGRSPSRAIRATCGRTSKTARSRSSIAKPKRAGSSARTTRSPAAS